MHSDMLAMHETESTNLVAVPSPLLSKFLFHITIQQHSILGSKFYYIGEWKEGNCDGEGIEYIKVGIE